MKPQICRFLTLAVLGLPAACADGGADYVPILDGAPTAAYRGDLDACQALAREQRRFDHDAMAAVALGAGAGAALGGLDDDGDALGGAIVGAVAGGAAGAINGAERREAIIVECLRGRGHRVVG